MSDIQQARDVVTKWRDEALPGPWAKNQDTDWEGTAQAAITTANGPLTWDDHGGAVFDPGTARLIVGTAGNPDLLYAIDALLAHAYNGGTLIEPGLYHYAQGIATAIIAADERMNA